MVDKRKKFWKEFDGLSLSFSDQLNSEDFYNKLNYVKNFSEYNEYCGSLRYGPRGNAVKNICIKLLNYLKTNEISNKQGAQYDDCPLLNYWVYSRLSIILNSFDSTDIKLTFAQIVQVWNNFISDKLKKNENQTCKPISNIVAYDDWEKRKELYEYYVDYSPIYKSLPFFQDRCKEFYHYVESKKSLYEHFKKFCYPYKKNGCPELYTKYEEYHPDKVLSTFLCHQKIIDERAAAALEDPQKEDTFPAGETDSEAQSDDTLPLSTQSLPQKSHTVENVGNILFGVVATSMTSGALYRFTPLGNMIRNGLGWNSNNMRNFNGGDFRLYDYASEPFNPYTGSGEEHIIGYQPA
ncbi:PIR protein [Plasmodium vivax]|nr:PIR protein [Plasmodium vivax]